MSGPSSVGGIEGKEIGPFKGVIGFRLANGAWMLAGKTFLGRWLYDRGGGACRSVIVRQSERVDCMGRGVPQLSGIVAEALNDGPLAPGQAEDIVIEVREIMTKEWCDADWT